MPTKSTKGLGNVDAMSYRLDFLYNFQPSKSFVPYLAIGGGGTQLRDKTTNHTVYSPTATIGGGLKYFLTDSIALRMDLRQHFVFNGKRSDIYRYAPGSSGVGFSNPQWQENEMKYTKLS